MNEELINYLSKYIKVSDELAESVIKSSLIKKIDKGTIIIKEGDKYEEAYFIIKGCLRSYILKDGEDITIDFYIDEQPVIPMGNSEANPAEFNLECLEDSFILISTEKQEEILIKKYPELKSLCLKMSEILAIKIQNEFSKYKTSTPEERYLNLIQKKPELLQRVPQYQIASYLGVKPESLSRIKKRIFS